MLTSMIPGPPGTINRRPPTGADPGSPAARLASRIDRGARLAAGWLEAHPGIVLIVFSLLYGVGEASYASAAVLSHDEVWTWLVTDLPGWSGIWEGLAGGADFHPPLHYMLAQSGRTLFGNSILGFRLGSILGFWLMSVCLFAFVKYRSGTLFGAIAMLIPCAAASQHDAYVARGYALMLGFAALSMLCWQRASAGRWRPLSLAGLAVSIFLCIASHYYGVLIVLCLAAAEIVRGRERKRVDKPVWLAMGAGFSGLTVLWPFIQSARQQSPDFWAAPSLSGLFTVYQELLFEAVSPAVFAFLGFLLLDRILRRCGVTDGAPRAKPAPPAEYALAVALSMLPFVAFALAKTVTNAFHAHYVLPTIVGLALCFVFHAQERAARRELLGIVVLLCFFGWFVIQQRFLFLYGRELDAQPPGASFSAVSFDAADPQGSLPIVAPNRVEYLQYVYYWPAEYTRRLYLLVPGSGPPDHIESLARWSDLQVVKHAEFVAAHKRFLLYGMGGELGQWVLLRLADEGAAIEVKGSTRGQPIFEVTVPGG